MYFYSYTSCKYSVSPWVLVFSLSCTCFPLPTFFRQPVQKTGQLLWETSSSGVPRVILCQQPSLLPAPLQLRKPSSRSSITGKKTKGTYPPVFNYPRIAPHPSKKPPDKTSSNVDSQNLSKRVCTEQKSDLTPVVRSPPEQHLYKQPKLASSASSPRDRPSSSSSPSASSSQGSPSVSTVHTTTSSSSVTARGSNRNSIIMARHRRFLNTVEILRQSGLLDITLRTKELLQQSNATEREIAQLRQHAELLCEAARNPDCSFNGIAAWERLHRAMAESSRYPDLKLLQSIQIPSHPDSAGQPESGDSGSAGDGIRPGVAGNSNVPSSRLLRTLLEPNHNCPVSQGSQSERSRRLETDEKTSDKVTFMPPDSSTG